MIRPRKQNNAWSGGCGCKIVWQNGGILHISKYEITLTILIIEVSKNYVRHCKCCYLERRWSFRSHQIFALFYFNLLKMQINFLFCFTEMQFFMKFKIINRYPLLRNSLEQFFLIFFKYSTRNSSFEYAHCRCVAWYLQHHRGFLSIHLHRSLIIFFKYRKK